mmetsp:Transcript_3069/g.7289  ORF Transcript_3069/g.7289 Transcript_3069/m.7289 type:complete len:593 (-) Transcript_3069:742-2520(-)
MREHDASVNDPRFLPGSSAPFRQNQHARRVLHRRLLERLRVQGWNLEEPDARGEFHEQLLVVGHRPVPQKQHLVLLPVHLVRLPECLHKLFYRNGEAAHDDVVPQDHTLRMSLVVSVLLDRPVHRPHPHLKPGFELAGERLELMPLFLFRVFGDSGLGLPRALFLQPPPVFEHSGGERPGFLALLAVGILRYHLVLLAVLLERFALEDLVEHPLRRGLRGDKITERLLLDGVILPREYHDSLRRFRIVPAPLFVVVADSNQDHGRCLEIGLRLRHAVLEEQRGNLAVLLPLERVRHPHLVDLAVEAHHVLVVQQPPRLHPCVLLGLLIHAHQQVREQGDDPGAGGGLGEEAGFQGGDAEGCHADCGQERVGVEYPHVCRDVIPSKLLDAVLGFEGAQQHFPVRLHRQVCGVVIGEEEAGSRVFDFDAVDVSRERTHETLHLAADEIFEVAELEVDNVLAQNAHGKLALVRMLVLRVVELDREIHEGHLVDLPRDDDMLPVSPRREAPEAGCRVVEERRDAGCARPEEDDAADDEAHPGDLPEDRDRVYVAVSDGGDGDHHEPDRLEEREVLVAVCPPRWVPEVLKHVDDPAE